MNRITGAAARELAELQRLADEDLMPLLAAKDAVAFEVFYDRHGGAAYSLAYRIVGERQAAEDVTQEALISIWRSGARFDRARERDLDPGHRPQPGDRPPAPPLRPRPEAGFRFRGGAERRPAEELTDAEALRRETANEVRGALDELPEDQSRVIQLAFFGGFSHSGDRRDAERALGTIKGRMRLGMDKIRASLVEGVLDG